eukprot:Tbor_TRINITY_DN3649_c0_g1::TRINITY_DN3649_c0_g1_i2::g.243::m.243
MQRTICLLRHRTAWRELLHPLPNGHRRMQWLKRDRVELNEKVLRQPYYTLAPNPESRQKRITELRESLVFSGATGPQISLPGRSSTTQPNPHSDDGVPPRYPSGWNLIPPMGSK